MSAEGALARQLCAWVDFVRERARATVAICGLLTVLSVLVSANLLGVDSDTIRLFPEDLPARRNHDAFVSLFPNLENALLIVIDAETPELARDSARRLIDELSADTEHFEDVYLPAGGLFFERNALLYRSVEELEDFGDQLALVQPVVAELERDGSIANLAAIVEEGLRRIEGDRSQDAFWSEVLEQIGRASVDVYEEHPLAISWEEVLLRGSAIETMTRRVVVSHPILDFENALPATAPIAAVRDAIAELELVPERGIRVRLTGNPALNHEETLSLVWDIGVAGFFCLLIVCTILFLALRSLRLVAAVTLTLLTGLLWTAAFAACAVGNLNVISIAAGVLFLGLGVDFGIHLGMRYADLLRQGRDHASALRGATRSVGGSLVLCTGTTAIGFFAFLPTDYRGVAELGLITGVGLIIILFLTLTLFPALLGSFFRIDPRALQGRSLRFRSLPFRVVEAATTNHPAAIRRIALLVGVAGLALLPQARFDANIVAMRDPSTESVQTFNDLLADAGSSSPWYANSVASSLAEADELKLRLGALEAVDRSITLSDYIPADQEEKLEILEDISFIMGSGGEGGFARAPRLSVEAQVAALRSLHSLLGEFAGLDSSSPLWTSVLDLEGKLGNFLDRVQRDPSPERALAELEEILLSTLPAQIERLRRSLAATRVTRSDLPKRLVERMIAPDGRARVQAFPSENLVNHAAFSRFVSSVQDVDPNTTGVAVNLVEFARTTREAFRQALLGAVLVIAAILWLRWRNVREMLAVLAPLCLAAVLTAAVTVLLDTPFNFFNVVVIPLLLGAGVDSGIHLVDQARREAGAGGGVLGTTTARAVFFSALTTITSFGSLALSSHVGLSGLGTLLTAGMFLSLLCNLVVLPTLLQAAKSDQRV